MKLLVLENGYVDEFLEKRIKQYKGEVVIADNLHSPEGFKKLIHYLSIHEFTDVLFLTTWLYQDITEKLYNLLTKIPYSLNIYSIGNENPCLKILEAIDVKNGKELDEYMSVSKHNFYTMQYRFKDAQKHEWIVKENSKVEEFIRNVNFQKDTSNHLKDIYNSPTNEYVLIKKVNACGKEFDILNEGNIVAILPTPKTDEKPFWGIWVKGATEPVKLINSNFNIEYEYLGEKQKDGSFKLKCEGLTKEIFSSSNKSNINSLFSLVLIMFNRIGGSSDIEIYHTLQEILDTLEIPRRFYREYFYQKLLKYKSEHTYSKELSTVVENSLIQTNK